MQVMHVCAFWDRFRSNWDPLHNYTDGKCTLVKFGRHLSEFMKWMLVYANAWLSRSSYLNSVFAGEPLLTHARAVYTCPVGASPGRALAVLPAHSLIQRISKLTSDSIIRNTGVVFPFSREKSLAERHLPGSNGQCWSSRSWLTDISRCENRII